MRMARECVCERERERDKEWHEKDPLISNIAEKRVTFEAYLLTKYYFINISPRDCTGKWASTFFVHLGGSLTNTQNYVRLKILFWEKKSRQG